jgi:hypothetical protein
MDNEGTTKRESGVLAFLEDENGKVINRHERKRLYAELRGFWNDHIDSNHPPDNWSSAGAIIRDKFRDILEEKFPFLRLCAGRWKVEALWKKNYHSWKRSLLARKSKRTLLLDAHGSDDGGKRKRKGSLEPVDANDEAQMSLDVPRPKKVRAGTASGSGIQTIPSHKDVSDAFIAVFSSAATFRLLFQRSTQLKNTTLSSKVCFIVFYPLVTMLTVI